MAPSKKHLDACWQKFARKINMANSAKLNSFNSGSFCTRYMVLLIEKSLAQ